MFVACVFVSALLAFMAVGSGLAKLNGVPKVTQLLEHVGAAKIAVPLGVLEIAGAIGLVVGLFVGWIGIAAAIGLILYFVGALLAHIRVEDSMTKTLNATLPLMMACAALLLRIATL